MGGGLTDMPNCMHAASEEELERQVGSGTQALYWSKATSHVQNYIPIQVPNMQGLLSAKKEERIAPCIPKEVASPKR